VNPSENVSELTDGFLTDSKGLKVLIYRKKLSLFINTSVCQARARAMRVRTHEGVV
jgi:hypothetical protein